MAAMRARLTVRLWQRRGDWLTGRLVLWRFNARQQEDHSTANVGPKPVRQREDAFVWDIGDEPAGRGMMVAVCGTGRWG